MNSLIVVYWCKFTSNHFCSKFTQILRQFESKNRSELIFLIEKLQIHSGVKGLRKKKIPIKNQPRSDHHNVIFLGWVKLDAVQKWYVEA